jgi:RNA polymerase sigma factor for flagellar operon FliA
MDAVSSFDPMRGVKFQTFALKRIMGAMSDSLRSQDIAPRLARRREGLVRKARDDFRKKHGRTPTEEELLRLLHADAEEARAILDGAAIPNIGSMTAPGEDGDGKGRPEPTIAVADRRGTGGSPIPIMPVPARDLQRWLGRGLSRSERLIIWLYYFEDLTMKEIGQTLGICEGRVSQIHALLLERLRARMVREQETGE